MSMRDHMLKVGIAGLSIAMAGSALAQSRGSIARSPDLGQPIAADDLAGWDIEIPPSGKGLPPGSGNAKAGEAVYASQCQSCHGPKGAGKPNDALVGGVGKLAGSGPALKTVGSYWPYATTVFDYIRRAMPVAAPRSLTNDEVYAVTAYLLHQNGIIGESDVIDASTLPAVKMPNRDSFTSLYKAKR